MGPSAARQGSGVGHTERDEPHGDTVLTVGTDPVIDSGTTSALGAGVTSSAIPFTNTWPGAIVVKNYWLFVRVFAADDILDQCRHWSPPPKSIVASAGSSAATPGSSLPSRNSSEAPPPVLT